MAKAQQTAWEVIHVQEIDLDILEGDTAAADAECQLYQQLTHNPDGHTVALAAAHLRLAELDYLQAVASPTPRLEPLPTPTRTLTPTPTPRPRLPPSPWLKIPA